MAACSGMMCDGYDDVIADGKLPEPIVLSEKGAPLNVVTISATRDSEPSIRLKVEGL